MDKQLLMKVLECPPFHWEWHPACIEIKSSKGCLMILTKEQGTYLIRIIDACAHTCSEVLITYRFEPSLFNKINELFDKVSEYLGVNKVLESIIAENS